MNRDSFVRGVLYGEDRSPFAFLLRSLLTPLAWLHQIGLELYLLPFRLGLRTRYRLPVPVIAIGNLSSGGTGKTPMAALVAGKLNAQGKRVVLLSRGHGGSNESNREPRIVSDGERILLPASEAGDEPVLLASLLPGIPVVVCRDRRKSGRLAVERFSPEIIVLDDALQYWQLHRDLDIVLLDASRPFDNGSLLPRGLLREPPSHLSRAGIAVLTRADRVSESVLTTHQTRIHGYAPKTAVFTAVHAPLAWIRASDEAILPLDILSGQSVIAFSGIADGAAFTESVRAQGVNITTFRDFGDHHPYTAEEVTELVQQGHNSGVSVAVTTEKDLTKLKSLWSETNLPLYALRVGMRLNEESTFFTKIYSIVFGMNLRPSGTESSN